MKKTIISLAAILSVVSIGQAVAVEQQSIDPSRYAIVVGAENRTFMIDKTTGSTWRYFRDSDTKQGWLPLQYYNLDGTLPTTDTNKK